MILGSDNRKRWSDLDVLILQAYQILEEERCSQCGLPKWICQNEDPMIDIVVGTYHCPVKAEIEIRDEGDSGKERPKGTTLLPEIRHRGDLPLHKLRESYREQLRREAEEEAD